ncbi:Urmylation protein [Serendipita sp. 401]|nr:Urmylation protein [Serendipita sp. 401]
MTVGENTARKYPMEIKDVFIAGKPWTILDVRSPAEFSICHLQNSISERLQCCILCTADYMRTDVPLSELLHDPKSQIPPEGDIIVVCRLGNDSQIAAKALQEVARTNAMDTRTIVDMVGGLRAWSRDVDPDFPVY